MTTEKTLRTKIVDKAKSYLGAAQGSAKHKEIIDAFNTVKPDGGAMTYTAYWCAAFASAMAIMTFGKDAAKKYFPLSWNCDTIITKAKALGIWKESDAYKPEAGDWILYDWEDNGKGDNVGSPNHVGIVDTITRGVIRVIEGNKNKAVGVREIPVNGRYIRGFVLPDYEEMAKAMTKKKEPAPSKMAKKVAKLATDFSYKYNKDGIPDKAKYPKGKPKKAYKEALNKYYPDRKSWSAAPRKGASCDVFAGTVIRASGLDKKFPRSLGSQLARLKKLVKDGKLKEVKKPTASDLIDGDIIYYKKTTGGGHICIIAGKKVHHAAIRKYYGVTTNNRKRMLSKKDKNGKTYKKHVYVFRPIKK